MIWLSWAASPSMGGRPEAASSLSVTRLESEACRIWIISSTWRFRSRAWIWNVPVPSKASTWETRVAARETSCSRVWKWAAEQALNSSAVEKAVSEDPSGHRSILANSRLPFMAPRRLLKSWAMPPASRPRASSFSRLPWSGSGCRSPVPSVATVPDTGRAASHPGSPARRVRTAAGQPCPARSFSPGIWTSMAARAWLEARTRTAVAQEASRHLAGRSLPFQPRMPSRTARSASPPAASPSARGPASVLPKNAIGGRAPGLPWWFIAARREAKLPLASRCPSSNRVPHRAPRFMNNHGRICGRSSNPGTSAPDPASAPSPFIPFVIAFQPVDHGPQLAHRMFQVLGIVQVLAVRGRAVLAAVDIEPG